MDTGIAATAFFRTEPYFAVFIRKQGSFRAFSHTAPAIPAEVPGLRIVTVTAVKVAALQKNCSPVSGTIHCAERNDLIYRYPAAARICCRQDLFLLFHGFTVLFSGRPGCCAWLPCQVPWYPEGHFLLVPASRSRIFSPDNP